MSDEQRRMAQFQAATPEGPGPLSRIAASLVAYVRVGTLRSSFLALHESDLRRSDRKPHNRL
jgi:hypothetical protein